MEYKFKEGEESKPLEERTIEKTGQTVTFSMLEMLQDQNTFEKTLREAKGNRGLKDGICANLEMHHPFLKDMPEFDRYTVHLYQEAWALRKAYDERIAKIEKEYQEYSDELAEIAKQIPELEKIIPVKTPYLEPDPQPEAPHETVLDVGEQKTNEQENNQNENKENA